MKYDQIACQKLIGTIKEPLQTEFKPGLSVCMICKDNKNIIERAIKSLSFADEICVYDTGSTDGTQTILARLGVLDTRLHWKQGFWDDDFSRARNCSVDMATYKWIIWIDSDDVVPDSEHIKFVTMKASPLDTCFSVNVVNTSNGQPIGSEFSQIRMFPNHPAIRFQKRIHEQVIYTASTLGLHVKHTDVFIQHHGYEKADSNIEKAKRNIRISALEEDDMFEDPVFVWSIANSFQVLGQFKEALEQYLVVWKIPDLKERHNDIHAETAFNIGQMHEVLGEHDKAVEWYEECHKIAPFKLEPIYHQAEILFRAGLEEQAMKLYEEVLLTKAVTTLVANNATTIRISALKRIGEYSEKHEQWLDAGRVWENMILNFPYMVTGYERAIAAYSKTYKKDKVEEIKAKMEKAEKSKTLKFKV